MNRREASKKETRGLILGVARKLCADRGMEECTLRDVAKAAGVSPASIVVHFKSKTALFEEVLSADIDKAISRLMRSMPAKAPLLNRLMHLSKGMLRFYGKSRNIYRPLIAHTVFQPAAETPRMSAQSDRYIQFLVRLVGEEKATGRIRKNVDPVVAAASIFFLYLGALTVLLRMPETAVSAAEGLLATMTRDYLRGISSTTSGSGARPVSEACTAPNARRR